MDISCDRAKSGEQEERQAHWYQQLESVQNDQCEIKNIIDETLIKLELKEEELDIPCDLHKDHETHETIDNIVLEHLNDLNHEFQEDSTQETMDGLTQNSEQTRSGWPNLQVRDSNVLSTDAEERRCKKVVRKEPTKKKKKVEKAQQPQNITLSSCSMQPESLPALTDNNRIDEVFDKFSHIEDGFINICNMLQNIENKMENLAFSNINLQDKVEKLDKKLDQILQKQELLQSQKQNIVISSIASSSNADMEIVGDKINLGEDVLCTTTAWMQMQRSTVSREWCIALLIGVFGEEVAAYRYQPRRPELKAFPRNFCRVAKILYQDFIERGGQAPKNGASILNQLSRCATDQSGRRNRISESSKLEMNAADKEDVLDEEYLEEYYFIAEENY